MKTKWCFFCASCRDLAKEIFTFVAQKIGFSMNPTERISDLPRYIKNTSPSGVLGLVTVLQAGRSERASLVESSLVPNIRGEPTGDENLRVRVGCFEVS